MDTSIIVNARPQLGVTYQCNCAACVGSHQLGPARTAAGEVTQSVDPFIAAVLGQMPLPQNIKSSHCHMAAIAPAVTCIWLPTAAARSIEGFTFICLPVNVLTMSSIECIQASVAGNSLVTASSKFWASIITRAQVDCRVAYQRLHPQICKLCRSKPQVSDIRH